MSAWKPFKPNSSPAFSPSAKTRLTIPLFLMGAAAALVVLGCRGGVSADPPFHLIQNMDQQKRFEAQEKNPFFEDQRAMRLPAEGTVARRELREDDHLHRGKVNGAFAENMPNDESGEAMMIAKPSGADDVAQNTRLLVRGKERYGIFCTPCHDAAGTGQGIVSLRATQDNEKAPRPPSFHDERMLAMPIGQLYDVIANGARNMPSYAAQIPVRDRWAIAAYVRALQLSGRADLDQIPTERATEKRWEIR